MKKKYVWSLIAVLCLQTAFNAGAARKDERLHEDVLDAIEMLKKSDSSLEAFFANSHGYAIFPGVGKGAIGIGGALGKGEVFEKGEVIGQATLTQVTIGFQLGGQAYIEAVFFEDESTLENFKDSNLELSAQIGAVAAAEGAAKNAKYELGVAIFTVAKAGLMYEASVGGQKFKFKATKK